MTTPSRPTGITPRADGDPERLGEYRIAGRIGAGGMGTVYAAADPRGRPVALKVVKREIAADADFRARFAREVELVRRVRGTCLPAFFGADTGAERPWLATEYVKGPTLRQYVAQNGPMPGSMLLGFAAGTAEALTAIHAAGIVHRDLKPSNVICSPDGPRLLDFGIARAVEETAITRTGGLLGTPGWIAPEQYSGAQPHAAADMFAWGGLVAYAATGRTPFGTGHSNALAQRTLHGEPDLEGVPEELLPLVSAALSKDPSQRPTADQALHTLTRPADGQTSDATQVLTQLLARDWAVDAEQDPAAWAPLLPKQRWWRNRTVRLAAAAVLALVLVVAGSWIAGQQWGARSAPETAASADSDGSGASDGDENAADDDALAGTQEVQHRELTLRVPEEWVVHELELAVGGLEVAEGTDDALALQTDPGQECFQDPGEELWQVQCAFVLLVGPPSREFGSSGVPVTESSSYHPGTNPGPCREGYNVQEQPDPGAADGVPPPEAEEDLDVDGHGVAYREWLVPCMGDAQMMNYTQRLWHFPETLVIDEHTTESLGENLANAEISL